MVLLASYSTPPVGGAGLPACGCLEFACLRHLCGPPPPPLRQPPPARPVLLGDLESALGTFCCGSRGPCAETRKIFQGSTSALSCRTAPCKERMMRHLAQ